MPPSDVATDRKPREQKRNACRARATHDGDFWLIVEIFGKVLFLTSSMRGMASSVKEATRNTGLSPDAVEREARHIKPLSSARHTLCVHMEPFQTGSNNS